MPSESRDEFAGNTVPQLYGFVKRGTRQPLPVRGEVYMVYDLRTSKTDKKFVAKHSFIN
jgi:hypothetical protein